MLDRHALAMIILSPSDANEGVNRYIQYDIVHANTGSAENRFEIVLLTMYVVRTYGTFFPRCFFAQCESQHMIYAR